MMHILLFYVGVHNPQYHNVKILNTNMPDNNGSFINGRGNDVKRKLG
jgi:hypothetical protein